MKNFHRLMGGTNVGPLLLALARHHELWDQNTLRTTHPQTPHKEVIDIWLRFNRLPEKVEEVIDEHESIDYPAYAVLKEARPLIMGLMAHVQGERLGRCLITRLAPGRKIEPHVDGGAHAAYYDRFHIVLDSAPGSVFRCGDEHVQMSPGEIWWFDNSIEHSVVNNSAIDRLHLIVDIKLQ